MSTEHHHECSRQTRQRAKTEQSLQQLLLQTLVLHRKEFQAGLQRRPSQNSLFGKNVQHLFIETWLIVPAQHTSSSKDSPGHVDTSGLLRCDPLVPRVLTAPLQLDSNLLVTLEGALVEPLTCPTRHFLCAHHWPASHRSKRGAPNLASRPHSTQA